MGPHWETVAPHCKAPRDAHMDRMGMLHAHMFGSGCYMGEEPVLRCTAPTKALEGAQPTKDKPHRARGKEGRRIT